MAKKVDPSIAVSEELLRILESQRDLSGDAYSTTLRHLAALCEAASPPELVLKAVEKNPLKAKVIVEKVDGKPSLDSPVYLKTDELVVLSARMLKVLESQRNLGDGAYPPTLGRLAELCGLRSSDTRVPKAANQGDMKRLAVVTAKTKPVGDALVVLKEDVENGASAVLPTLLRFAMSPVTTTVKKVKVETNAFTAADLVKRFVPDPDLKTLFETALPKAIDRQDLPSDVAWVLIKGNPHLFLIENLRPEGLRQSSPAEVPSHAAPHPLIPDESSAVPTRPDREFAGAFRAAFEQLDRHNRLTNFVKLSDLRRALPEFGREEFDAGLRQLQINEQFSLESHEGLYGSLTPEEREAGVHEAGSLLIYASRR